MRGFVTGTAIIAALTLLVAGAGRAQEEKVGLEKLPKAVRDAVKAKFPGATLVEASQEKDDGKTVYEVTLKYRDHNHDVTYQADGVLVSVEKEITAKDLPPAVADTLAAKYPKASYKRVEEITKGTAVSYEVLLTTAQGRTVEVVVDPRGSVLNEEAQDGKVEEKGEKK